MSNVLDNSQLYGVRPAGIVSPLTKLSPEQQVKLNELREITKTWDLKPAEREFCDDLCLFRYLSGLQWNVENAQKQLHETVIWRESYKPQDIRLKDLKPIAESGWLFHFGFDKQSRPIIYVLMGKDKTENTEENKLLKFKYFVYINELCIKRMPEGVHNITWIVDLKDSTVSMALVKQMKDMFVKLGDYYTERLAKCIVVNVGFYLNLMWQFVKPFLAQETVDKYTLIKYTDKEPFYAAVNKEQLPKDFFGDVDYVFDYDALVKAEEEQQ
ncbi:CRAL-TRIO domain-containing protein [Acrasis kona]|uniref:CRAL-TRIO domain-containing protein n=1 Tax=Acrasis kona TaxID=1008807 RepID=A0AAW2ZEG2_9EUKA